MGAALLSTLIVRESIPPNVEFGVFWGVSIFGCLLFWTVVLSLLLG